MVIDASQAISVHYTLRCTARKEMEEPQGCNSNPLCTPSLLVILAHQFWTECAAAVYYFGGAKFLAKSSETREAREVRQSRQLRDAGRGVTRPALPGASPSVS